MILVGIDIGKKQHTFSIIDKGTGEILANPSVFNNNQERFLLLIRKLSSYVKSELLIDMKDTGHYHFALLKYLLDRHYTVALLNPTTTDLTRKLQGALLKMPP
ncbi:MAG: IS110 family transposase [Mediterraneibacter gnavus]